MKTKARANVKIDKQVELWCDYSQEARNLQMQLQAAGYKLKVINTASQQPVLNYRGALYSDYAEIRVMFSLDSRLELPLIELTLTRDETSPELSALIGAARLETLIDVTMQFVGSEEARRVPSLPMLKLLKYCIGPEEKRNRTTFGPENVALLFAQIAYGGILPKWAYAPK